MENPTQFSRQEEYFIKIIRAVEACGRQHVKILLKWLTTDYHLFPYGVSLYIKLDHKPIVGLFTAGLDSLRETGRGAKIFPIYWTEMLQQYDNRYGSKRLDGGLLNNIKLVRRDSLGFFEKKRKHYELNAHKRIHREFVVRLPEEEAKEYMQKFLVTSDIQDRPRSPYCNTIWKEIPIAFRVMDTGYGCEIWMDGNSIIGGRGAGKLTSYNQGFVRDYIESIYDNQYTVKRSLNREAMGHTMRAVGPLINYRDGNAGKAISFYKNAYKLKNTTPINSEILELLHEQCSHRLLYEILLVLFAVHLWPAVGNLIDIQNPFMKVDKDLMKYFGEGQNFIQNGVPSYPLFMTKDYCNQVHIDDDTSTFTLGLVSNPNIDAKGGYLTIIDYGVIIPLLEGDIFFFRGQDRHATSLRTNVDVAKPVYVIATSINRKLGKHFEFVNKSP